MSGKFKQMKQRSSANSVDTGTLSINEKILMECYNLYTEPSKDETPKCISCDNECGTAHKCKICKSYVHIIVPCVGKPAIESDEGYGSSVVCKKCFEISEKKKSLPHKKRRLCDFALANPVCDFSFDTTPHKPPSRKILGWEDEYLEDEPHQSSNSSARLPSPPQTSTSGIDLFSSDDDDDAVSDTPTVSRLRTPKHSSDNDDGDDNKGKKEKRRRSNEQDKEDRTINAVTKRMKELQDYNFTRWKKIDERQEQQLLKFHNDAKENANKMVSLLGKQIENQQQQRQDEKAFRQDLLTLLGRTLAGPQQQQPTSQQQQFNSQEAWARPQQGWNSQGWAYQAQPHFNQHNTQ